MDDWEIRGYEGVTHSGIIVSDPNDAHVLSAALHCGADYLVTANVRDFRASAEPPPIQVLSPDAFLCILSKSKLPELLLVLIEAQKHLSRPPKTMPEYLHGLREVGLIECSEVFKQEMLRLELS
ncbi:MAG: hypothetical protein KDK78_03835 [Chlamydiia bacterium]|nr:hypothetical protein [Chlamydiia bacterium]